MEGGMYAGQAVSKQALGRPLNQGYDAPDAKPDGLMSCLSRIRDLTAEFGMDVRRIEGIADALSGARPENAGNKATQPPEPQNALFIARQIEMALGEILTAQRGQIVRLEQAIS